MSLIVIISLLTSPLLHYKTDWDDKRVVLSRFYGANGSEFVKYPILRFESSNNSEHVKLWKEKE